MVRTTLPELSISTIFKGSIPFFAANVIALVLVGWMR